MFQVFLFSGSYISVVSSDQGFPNFFSEGHISSYARCRGRGILRNVIVSEYLTFCQINKLFVNTLFFHY